MYGTSLDDMISSSISRYFPPSISNSLRFFPESVFGNIEDKVIQETVASLVETGLAVLPMRIPNATIDLLRSNIIFHPSKTARSDALESELLAIPTIKSLWLDSILLQVAELYFDSTPILDFVYASRTVKFFDESEATKEHDAQQWHFDKDRIKFLKVFIYLTDVEKENGPHEFLQCPHRSPPGYDGRLTDEFVKKKYGDSLQILVLGPAGTVFIEDTHGLHRGTPVFGDPREVLQFEYCNSLFGEVYPRLPLDFFSFQFPNLVKHFPRLFHRFLP